jgi:hypothetical protein
MERKGIEQKKRYAEAEQEIVRVAKALEAESAARQLERDHDAIGCSLELESAGVIKGIAFVLK